VCSADVPIIRIDRGNNDSSDIEIRDMVLSYPSMETTNSFHIEADRPVHLKICGVTFSGESRLYAGVLTWEAPSGNRSKPIEAGSNYAAFMTHIEGCVFQDASIWLNDSDSRIINNYIWGNKSGGNVVPYAVRLSNGAVNISGNDIVPGNGCGVYLASTCDGIRIENNYFDGSWIPRVQDININFVGSASNSAVVYSIWGLSYAGFYVAIRPVDSNSSSAGILYWRVSLQ